MGLFTGSTKIDAVYVGGAGGSGSGSTAYSKVLLKYSDANRSGRADFGHAYPGDLLVLVLGYPVTAAPSISGFTLYKTKGSSGLGNTYSSSIYYKFATTTGSSSANMPGINADWMSFVFTGAHPTTPFGAYADVDHGSSNSNMYAVPAITMTQPNGFSQVLSFITGKSTVGQWMAIPTGYTAGLSQDYWNQWAILRTDRTTASVISTRQSTNTNQTAFSHTLELLPNSVVIEPGIANAVYLGAEKVWPVITKAEQIFSTPGTFTYTVPAGAKMIDIVCLGGAGGGGKGDISGPGHGGVQGSWLGRTLRVGLDIQANQSVSVLVGKGGKGNTDLLDATGPGATGEPSWVLGFVEAPGGIGGSTGGITNQQGMPGTAGGEPANFVFNGRTYVGGKGGVPGSNQSGTYPGYGLDGNAPSVGGEGGDGVPIGYNGGGTGGAGRVWVYAY
jgi:hypothetical protein